MVSLPLCEVLVCPNTGLRVSSTVTHCARLYLQCSAAIGLSPNPVTPSVIAEPNPIVRVSHCHLWPICETQPPESFAKVPALPSPPRHVFQAHLGRGVGQVALCRNIAMFPIP